MHIVALSSTVKHVLLIGSSHGDICATKPLPPSEHIRLLWDIQDFSFHKNEQALIQTFFLHTFYAFEQDVKVRYLFTDYKKKYMYIYIASNSIHTYICKLFMHTK